MRFLALDLETTGTVPGQDRIVEFTSAELDHNGSEHTVRTERVNPEVPIPAAATAIHGITDADVATQPTFATLAPRIQGLLEGDVCLVAYRAMFDVRFLHHELVRAGQRGIPASVPVVDPYVLFLEDAPRTLADALRFYCGEEHTGAHGSATDVRAMARVLRAQLECRGRSLAQVVLVPEKQWLAWDRKVHYADPHDVDNRYTWTDTSGGNYDNTVPINSFSSGRALRRTNARPVGSLLGADRLPNGDQLPGGVAVLVQGDGCLVPAAATERRRRRARWVGWERPETVEQEVGDDVRRVVVETHAYPPGRARAEGDPRRRHPRSCGPGGGDELPADGAPSCARANRQTDSAEPVARAAAGRGPPPARHVSLRRGASGPRRGPGAGWPWPLDCSPHRSRVSFLVDSTAGAVPPSAPSPARARTCAERRMS